VKSSKSPLQRDGRKGGFEGSIPFLETLRKSKTNRVLSKLIRKSTWLEGDGGQRTVREGGCLNRPDLAKG